jgi:prepilin signal peptidase PulO-like enzyme (type II secretory pathway)
MKRLTAQEQENVRVALRFLRIRTGGWKVLSKVLGFAMGSMINVKKKRVPVSVNLAFQVSRLTMVPFDDLLAGKYPPAGACPHCGHGVELPESVR